jgi:hypothetical protein
MKRIPFFICLLLAGFPILAQQGSLVLDSTVTFGYTSPDDSTRQWKHVNEYDVHGNLTGEADYSWIWNKNSWVGDGKVRYEYDTYGNIILKEYQYWDEIQEKWVWTGRDEWTFDASGNETMRASYGWDPDLEQWVGSFRDEIHYNAKGDIDSSSK